jgi:hypothetical protein
LPNAGPDKESNEAAGVNKIIDYPENSFCSQIQAIKHSKLVAIASLKASQVQLRKRIKTRLIQVINIF